ncbi:MAG TPA: aconitate hydratase AcnA [Bacteroidota bacterium]|nr:aconitate hydratase AcnA [Bacteroidota bacterium]
MKSRDSYSVQDTMNVKGVPYSYYALGKLPGQAELSRLPFSLRILLENLLRHEDGVNVRRDDIEALLRWNPAARTEREISFMPARVLLQDFTGVPCAVDLAVMRDAMGRMGGDPGRINPLLPVDLVIDHSVQVDEFGSDRAFQQNAKNEFARNNERYTFLRWTQQAFRNFRVVPPDTGIVHQVNLEYFATVVFAAGEEQNRVAYPDTLVGTDSHTTMINGLGVLGWGVGGIEAEAAMLGQPISMLLPPVVGFRLAGSLRAGVTATDLVLTITQLLRKHGVVGKFVEFYGAGISSLSLADRATIANMAPEYGATMGFFPVDAETLAYLRFTRRSEPVVDLAEAYCKAQGLFRTDATPDPQFTEYIELDLATVEASIAGPRRPQDRIALKQSRPAYRRALVDLLESKGKKLDPAAVERWLSGAVASGTDPLAKTVPVKGLQGDVTLGHGAVVLAAITSCTNTSNPSVLIAAGLLARNAAARGLHRQPWVKTSLAPGSKVVTAYLREAGLLKPLEELGFHLVGYGCTTCIGNSGPLPQPVSAAIQENDLVVAAVLSGNRNFEGRINSQVRANYLASPPLVVAYAIAGTMDIDFENDPLGTGPGGKKVFLRDIWPSSEEIADAMRRGLKPEMFAQEYGNVFRGSDEWSGLPVPSGNAYKWDTGSTYIKAAPYFNGMRLNATPPADLRGARVLAVLGDSVTTDHISPAGSIPAGSPAGRYLIDHGVSPADFNSYGARRGNHEVMMRGTFANIRLRNQLAPGTEGGWTVHPSSPEPMTIFDASVLYAASGTPLIILAGKEYGSGSSRDWAAKGPRLLGVRAVIAESFERIHRSNLVGMGILPLQFREGENRSTLGLTGFETFDITGVSGSLAPKAALTVAATGADGRRKEFTVVCRIDTPMEVEYYRNDGILPYVLRSLLRSSKG